ncbi:hypothetical protein F3K44_31690 [Bacillus megaterium]|nr:hypothetical protein [Priestia megaterium]
MKIVIKKMIQSNDESIQFYEGDQKSIRKDPKLSEKQQDLAMKKHMLTVGQHVFFEVHAGSHH